MADTTSVTAWKSPENYWKDALKGSTDEWGLSAVTVWIRPGDWVWAYFVQPIGQVLGVGKVTDVLGWRDDWQRHTVSIRWNRDLTRELKKNPIHYEEYRQPVPESGSRANPAAVEAFEVHLGHTGFKKALTSSERVQFAQRKVMQPPRAARLSSPSTPRLRRTVCHLGLHREGRPASGAHPSRPTCRYPRHQQLSATTSYDVHNLFDLGLITVSKQLRIEVASSVTGDFSYRKLDGQKIRMPHGADQKEVIAAYAAQSALGSMSLVELTTRTTSKATAALTAMTHPGC